MCRMQTPQTDTTYYRLGPEIPPSDFVAAERTTEGTGRLQRDYLTGEDGSFVSSWRVHDTQRDEDCFLDYGVDGELRCMPSGTLSLGNYYANTTCSEEVAVLALFPCSDPGSYVSRSLRDTCPARTQVYQIGPAQPLPRVYYSYDDMCMDSGIDPATYDFYTAGVEVNAASFERFDLLLEPGSERLRQESYVTADGFRLGSSWRDTQRDESCSFGRATDDTLRCMTFDASIDPDLYSDMACTMPFRAGRQYIGWCGSGEAAPTAIVEPMGECPIRYKLYQVGGPMTVTGSLYWRSSDGMCFPQESGDGTFYRYYQIGPEIPPSMLVKASELTE
jgi:hypothetical protein